MGVIVHNVDVDAINAAATAAASNPEAALVKMHLGGTWNTDADHVQFSGEVGYPEGMVTLTADFPSLLGGQGRAPSALAYCFYGAMCCYASTYATQAAMEGVEIDELTITLDVGVDFRSALGLGDHVPMTAFQFHLEVASDASEGELDRIKELSDKRCPAIWAMNNPVPHHVVVTKQA
jgi:uncharacterized OsmC-like protein